MVPIRVAVIADDPILLSSLTGGLRFRPEVEVELPAGQRSFWSPGTPSTWLFSSRCADSGRRYAGARTVVIRGAILARLYALVTGRLHLRGEA